MAKRKRGKGVRRNVGFFYAARLKEFRAREGNEVFARPAHRIADLRRLVRRAGGAIDYKSRKFWKHQNESTKNIVDHLGARKGDPQTISVIPTAGGKTEIFLRLIAAFTEARAGRIFVPNTIVLVPTQNLIEQTLRRAAEGWPSMPTGYISSKPAYAADGTQITQGIAPVTLMTYEGFVALVREGSIRPRDVDFLVLDEAHRALSDLRQEIFGAFLGNTLVSGFSATPAFNDEQDLHLLLGAENEVVNITAKRLRDDGIIAPAVNYVYAISLEGTPPKGGAGSPAMKRLGVRSGLDFYESYRDPETGQRMLGKPTLGYCSDIEQARLAATAFNRRYRARGLKAIALTGQDTSARQGEVLRRLATGEIHAVMNVKLLQEGIDLPCVRNIVNFASTSSAVRASQRGGRGVRWDFDYDQDADQTVAIVDCFFERNGAPQGSPRFYYETIGDPTMARFIRKPRIRKSGSPRPKDKERRLPRRPTYEVAPHLALVAYLRRTRDGGTSVIGELPQREDGYLSKTDMAKRLGAGGAADRKRLGRAWRSLIRAFDPRGYCRFENRIVDARFARSARKKVFCLNADEVGWFCRRFRFEDRSVHRPAGPVAARTADWLTLSEVRNRFRTSTLNREIKDLFEGWANDLLAGRNPKLGARTLRAEFRATGRGPKVCLHRSELRTLAEHIGLPHRGSREVWLRRDRLRELAGEGVDRVLNAISDDLTAGRQPFVGGVAIRAKLLGDKKILRVHHSAVKAIIREMKASRRNGDDRRPRIRSQETNP